jgi:ADP-dependent NAD(P)H-hydrate dehydratase / NAD(P)H-hydrate epimerase
MITSTEMKELEEQAAAEGTSKLELMERAGQGIAEYILDTFSKEDTLLFICYHGNNGGDGFTAARLLDNEGYDVKVLFVGEEAKLANEARVNYDILRREEKHRDLLIESWEQAKHAKVVVDCMLGMGGKGELQPKIKALVEEINRVKEAGKEQGVRVIAVDIPTGVDADTGEVLGEVVHADTILAMHDLKPGLEQYKDKVKVLDIGL